MNSVRVFLRVIFNIRQLYFHSGSKLNFPSVEPLYCHIKANRQVFPLFKIVKTFSVNLVILKRPNFLLNEWCLFQASINAMQLKYSG